jgi:hypothetical protein
MPYVNKMGFRAIERHHGVDNTMLICWVKQIGQPLPQAPSLETAPAVAQLDELQTFVGKKRILALDSNRSGQSGYLGVGVR